MLHPMLYDRMLECTPQLEVSPKMRLWSEPATPWTAVKATLLVLVLRHEPEAWTLCLALHS